MKIIYSKLKKGEKDINEDTYGFVSNLAFVIDGATDVFDKKMIRPKAEVKWYVNTLKRELIKVYNKKKSLTENLKTAVKNVYDKINTNGKLSCVKEYLLPTFSIAMIKVQKGTFEYYVLGDCYISYKTSDKPVVVKDHRIEKFSSSNRKKVIKNRTNKLNIYRQTRKLANAKNGYPIGSVRGTSIAKGKKGTIDSKSDVLLFSDGIIDYLNEDRNRIIDLYEKKNIQKTMNDINSFDNDRVKYLNSGRPKQIDDKVIMLVGR